jgi:DNA-binding winged helix-turn-helix (wHTH) protein
MVSTDREAGAMTSDRYTLAYRASEVGQVMDWLKARQSGCLIGLRGVGTSNFLAFLRREDVRQHYLGQAYADVSFVLIDLLALAEQTEAAVYHLLLDRLLGQLDSAGVEPATTAEITRLQHQSPVQRLIERSLDTLCRRPSQRVVLLFDEFDAIFQNLPSALFRYLRSLRDSRKEQLSYIVVVANDLAGLRDDLTEVEHFYRLVSRNVCGLGPYSEADARQMIAYLAFRRSLELREEDTTRLIELSGGHAGLLKSILSLLWTTPQRRLAEISSSLNEEPAIQAECWKVWAGLPEQEQTALHFLLAEKQLNFLMLRQLKYKGLVRDDRPETLMFSPLFTDFVHRQAIPSAKEIIMSRSPRRVQFGERHIDTLTELEFETLYYLYEHRERVCTKDELIEHVYGQQYDRLSGGVSDAALQTLMARLRAKIEPSRGQPRYIITVRREGYKFVEPANLSLSGSSG